MGHVGYEKFYLNGINYILSTAQVSMSEKYVCDYRTRKSSGSPLPILHELTIYFILFFSLLYGFVVSSLEIPEIHPQSENNETIMRKGRAQMVQLL